MCPVDAILSVAGEYAASIGARHMAQQSPRENVAGFAPERSSAGTADVSEVGSGELQLVGGAVSEFTT